MTDESHYLLERFEMVKTVGLMEGEDSSVYQDAKDGLCGAISDYLRNSAVDESWKQLIEFNLERGDYDLARKGVRKIAGVEV